MDKREFDGGNPQQDAPRRVEKKKIWTRRRLLWLGIVAAVLLAVVAVSLLWQRGTFDGLRRSVIYARAEKDENGCAQLYQYAADREYRFVSLSGSLAAASNSRILLMGEDGQVRYSESILFTNCTVTGNGKWAAVYDVGGDLCTGRSGRGLPADAGRQHFGSGSEPRRLSGRDGKYLRL